MKTLLNKYSVIQRILVGLASKSIFFSSKNDPSKTNWIKNKNKNSSKITMIGTSYFELRGKKSCKNHKYSIYNQI